MANDPGWGNRNNEGPPDLDEVMRELSRKINGFFGKNLIRIPRQMRHLMFHFYLFLG